MPQIAFLYKRYCHLVSVRIVQAVCARFIKRPKRQHETAEQHGNLDRTPDSCFWQRKEPKLRILGILRSLSDRQKSPHCRPFHLTEPVDTGKCAIEEQPWLYKIWSDHHIRINYFCNIFTPWLWLSWQRSKAGCHCLPFSQHPRMSVSFDVMTLTHCREMGNFSHQWHTERLAAQHKFLLKDHFSYQRHKIWWLGSWKRTETPNQRIP